MLPTQLQDAIKAAVDGQRDAILPPEDAVKHKLETPESAFAKMDQVGWGYTPKFVDWNGLRMAYIDEFVMYDESNGKVVTHAEGLPVMEEVFLCIHGQPMWSFLYRKMLPVFLHNNVGQPTYSMEHANAPPRKIVRNRVICPDLIGFGRSSKPTNDDIYSYEFHIKSLVNFVITLGLYKQQEEGLKRRVTMVVQDWGGLLGLTIPPLFSCIQPSPFTRLIVMNTVLPIGRAASPGFLSWKAYAGGKDYDIGKMVKRGHAHITQDEQDAYNAPWPDVKYKAGVRKFPLLVPLAPEDPGDAFGIFARAFYQDEFWSRPDSRMFVCIGLKDPVFGTKPVVDTLLADLGGAHRMTVIHHPQAGHFVQEFGNFVAQQAMHYLNAVPSSKSPASKL